MQDIESPQRHGATYITNPVDDPMHDAHAEEVCLGQGLDTHLVQEQVVDCGGAACQTPKWVEASMIAGHD